ncbi:MAG: [acyl-carrier-protein] S-malonyltransferase [Candidatus Marinimicrobia bacterium]|nr:[acyl-carrier-protein] S-malonyltransferase [Candidatus Neomarinimicrobiota bacterium]|tara:strand:+ start:13453 stop:14349 length:897 start_codon:yes stop_codon:yes gene_type:complete
MNKVFIFPGQGSQYVGMGQKIAEFSNIYDEVFEKSNDILKYNIKKICLDGPQEILNKTVHTQPAIFINSIIKDRILKEKNIFPSAVAGHSLGEFSALVSANIISFEDSLKIIKIRSEEMHKSGKKNPGAMAAIIGANNEQIQLICNQKGIIVIANYNSNKQIIISGEKEAITNAIKTGKKIGVKKILPLKVSGAFHSPLMQGAKEKLKNIINKTLFSKSKIPIYQNITGKKEFDSNKIKINLINQIDNPVKWLQTITNMNNDKYNYFIEVGPKNVLKKINIQILKNSITKSFEELIKL